MRCIWRIHPGINIINWHIFFIFKLLWLNRETISLCVGVFYIWSIYTVCIWFIEIILCLVHCGNCIPPFCHLVSQNLSFIMYQFDRNKEIYSMPTALILHKTWAQKTLKKIIGSILIVQERVTGVPGWVLENLAHKVCGCSSLLHLTLDLECTNLSL